MKQSDEVRVLRADDHAPRIVQAHPLTAAAYARYGAVVMASGDGTGKAANQGTARRFDRLCSLENLRPQTASANVAVFRSAPWTLPMRVALLEKHPASTQMFIPMCGSRYLVVVAAGAEAPDLSTLAAFVATGRQGVSYGPGVWHHPLIALDAETDFACVVFEDGGPQDCVVHKLGPDEALLVTLGEPPA